MQHNENIQSENNLASPMPAILARARAGWKLVGALPVAAFIILMVILNLQGSSAIYEPPILLAILNTIFLCAIPLVVAIVAARSHQSTGIFAFLIIGCGLVFFGISSLYAGWVMPLAGNSNPTVTVHNLGCLFAGICQLVGVHFFIQELAGATKTRIRVRRYWILYGVIFVLVTITAVLAFLGNLPVFFDPLTGASPLRQLVLGAAICLFVISGLAFVEIYATSKTEFAYWYGLALLLITIGLICVLLQREVGSALGWAGRGAQYIGCIYFIFAFLWGRQELPEDNASSTSRTGWLLWPHLERIIGERTATLVRVNATMQKEITERKLAEQELIQSHERYRQLFENSGTSIIIVDENGHYLLANKIAAANFGKNPTEVIGTSMFDYLPRESADRYLERNCQLIKAGGHREYEDTFHLPLGERTFLVVDQCIQNESGRNYAIQSSSIDITERKRAEQALRISGERYRLLFESSDDAILLTSPDGRIHAANPAACRMFQRSEAEICQVGRNGIVDTTDPRLQISLEERENTGKSRAELTFIRSDGQPFPGEMTSVVFQAEDGQPRTSMIIRDITERKRVLVALHESEAEYRSLFENSIMGISQALPDGRLIRANAAYAHMYGYENPDEMIAKVTNIKQLYANPEDRKDVLRVLAAKGVMEPSEMTVARRDGTLIIILVSSREVRDSEGNLRYYQAELVDITERKKMEEKLVERESRLSALFDSAGYSISLAKNGIQILGNPAFVKLFGYKDTHELIGKPVVDTIAPEERNRIVKYIAERANDKEAHNHYEIKGLRRNGTTFDMEVMISTYIFNNEIYTVGFQNDITERTQAEKALAQSRDQLRALAAYYQTAVEDERTAIAREIHDEFGQSMTALKMDLSWLARRLPEKDERAERIKGMDSLVDDSITLMRRIATELRPNLLDDLGLSAALEWQAHEFSRRTNIECSLDLAGYIPDLDQFLRTSLFRIFQESLTNVSRHAQATLVSVSLEQQGQALILTIRDNGRGITDEEKNDPRALGLLGLRERAARWNGTLVIHGEPGQGTTVTVCIPLPAQAERGGQS